MKESRNVKVLSMFVLCLLTILLAKDVYAIGIAPSSMRFDFEPGLEKNLEFVAINNINKTNQVMIYATGNLSQYVTFSVQNMTLAPQETRPFTAHLKLPTSIEQGTNTLRIGITETQPEGEGTLAALAAVESIILINSSYPYIKPNINEPNTSVNESIEKTKKIEYLNLTSAFFIVIILLIVILIVIIQKRKVKKFTPDSIAVSPQKQ